MKTPKTAIPITATIIPMNRGDDGPDEESEDELALGSDEEVVTRLAS
jgi:hypothetical protein